jgi:hypothetical protein
MKYEGTVQGIKNCGVDAEIMVETKRFLQAGWRTYNTVYIRVPLSRAKSFSLGRRIIITVEPK